MKIDNVQQLIEKLSKYPGETKICVADWEKHIASSNDGFSNEGLYPILSVELNTEDVSESFVSLSFKS
jgi:hypothetical protein